MTSSASFIALIAICFINIPFTFYVFHTVYGYKLGFISRILVSLPLISTTYSLWIQSSPSLNPSLLIPNTSNNNIVFEWRLNMMHKHVGMTCFAISNVFWFMLIIMVKVTAYSIQNDKLFVSMNEFICCFFGILYLSIIIIKQFHSVNKLIIFWNWLTWLIEFITISIIIIHLFLLWLDSKSILILIIYIISVIQYFIYWIGIFLCLLQDLFCLLKNTKVPFLRLNYYLCFGYLFIYCSWLYFAQIIHDHIVERFIYVWCIHKERDDLWYNLSNWIILNPHNATTSMDKYSVINRKICCIMHALWQFSDKKDLDATNDNEIEKYFDKLYTNVSSKDLRDIFHEYDDESYDDSDFLKNIFWQFPFQILLKRMYRIIGSQEHPFIIKCLMIVGMVILSVIELIYLLSRLLIMILPIYILIESSFHYGHNISSYLIIICIFYNLLIIIWVYLSINYIYPLCYGLWHIFYLQDMTFLSFPFTDYIDYENIIKYYDQVLICQQREAVILKYCHDIGWIINDMIGRDYLKEIISPRVEEVDESND